MILRFLKAIPKGEAIHIMALFIHLDNMTLYLVESDEDNTVRYDLFQAERRGNIRSTTLKSITHEEAIKLAETAETI